MFFELEGVFNMKNKVYNFNKPKAKISEVKVVSKDSKRKKMIRLGALLGALLMIGTFLVSLLQYL